MHLLTVSDLDAPFTTGRHWPKSPAFVCFTDVTQVSVVIIIPQHTTDKTIKWGQSWPIILVSVKRCFFAYIFNDFVYIFHVV